MKTLAKTPETSSAARGHHGAQAKSSLPIPYWQSQPSLKTSACACGGGCPRCQAESTPPFSSGVLRRKCACDGSGKNCDDCEGDKLRRKSDGELASDHVPSIVHEVLASPGLPLGFSTRHFMESRLGHDFSRVRVHTDARARDSARAVAASAYTVGSDIVFAPGQYQPESSVGRKLLAHELAHVMQNAAAGSNHSGLTVGAANSVEERQADAIADRVEKPHSKLPQQHVGPSRNTLRRQPSDSEFVCNDKQVGEVSVRAPVARTYVNDALKKLDTEPQAAAQALLRHFKVSGPKAVETTQKIRTTLYRMVEKLEEIEEPLRAKTEVRCHSADEAVCQIADAYIDRSTEIPHFNLCASFFNIKNEKKQAEILVHESSHAADPQITDRAYLTQRFYGMLDTPAALANAESYSTFVMELNFGGSEGEFRFPKDTLVECPDRTLEKVIAYAEHWNWAALSAFADPNFLRLFGEILYNWGLAKRTNTGFEGIDNFVQTLATNYQTANDFLSSKQTVRCTTDDEVCKKRHGVMLKDKRLIVCATGPTAEPPSGCPGCVLGLLYSELGGLTGQLPTKAVAIATDIAAITYAPKRNPKQTRYWDTQYRTRPEVKRGDRGCPIPELQEKLIEDTGKKFKVTGKFDDDTEAAVIAFQESNGLIKAGARKGEVDEKTWAALHGKVPGEHGLPKGEQFKEGIWGGKGNKTQHDWFQILLPLETDFSGCWVKEFALNLDPSENTCCTSGLACPGRITGGAWLVKDNNRFGPDTVGISRSVFEGLRTLKKIPCGYAYPQAMSILRDSRDMEGASEDKRDEVIKKSDDAEYAEYIRNELLYKITDTDIRCGKRNKEQFAKTTTPYPTGDEKSDEK